MHQAAAKQCEALTSAEQTRSTTKHPGRSKQERRRAWTQERVDRRTHGIRFADLAEVREHLLGWYVNKSGTGSGAFIAVDAPGSNWIIGRCGTQFHAMRSTPGTALDAASLVDGFGSARDAAEMIRQTDG